MRRGRIISGAAAVAAVAAIGAPGALAATPQQIYKDYSDNGRLDHPYSAKDLQRALKDAVLTQYSGPTGQNVGPAINKQSNSGSAGVLGTQSPRNALPAATRSGGTLPFTGVDLALMTAGGLALLGLGAGMRRLGRSKA